jgi:hypothetical protein
MTAKSYRKTWKAALDQVSKEAHAQFPEHVGKLQQLDAILTSASMVVDDLHDLTPYVLPTER